jgi:hypothetical protein
LNDGTGLTVVSGAAVTLNFGRRSIDKVKNDIVMTAIWTAIAIFLDLGY